MCGICGFQYRDASRQADQCILRGMNDTLFHRGPDDEGYFLRGNTGLAMRRLSIIDVAGGQQPIANPSETLVIVYNGEVYNFPELRDELEKKGYRFRTKSDTEVVLCAYEEWGERCLDRFNGMFAFAIYDIPKRTLFLARDRCGEKPLYYCHTDGSFAFASELKALMRFPDIRREIDTTALQKYLAYEYVPSPYTILKSVRKLPPGHCMTLSGGNLQIKKYWGYYEDRDSAGDLPEEEASRRLMELLRESVRKRLVSDVPLGVFLSGGIDSSVVTALASQLLPPKTLKTFSIGFKDASFDESAHALTVSRACGTEHHMRICDEAGMLSAIRDIAEICDEPFADASILPTYLLSRFTRERVTVALGGDGGDELFAGYQTFQAFELWRRLQKVPDLVTLFMRRVAERLPVSFDYFSLDFKAKQFFKGYDNNPALMNVLWLSSFTPAEQKLLFAEGGDISPEGVYSEIFSREGLPAAIGSEEEIDAFYVRYYMSDDILFKVDRASMAASLEVRAPLLDADLLRFAAVLPWKYKMRGMTTKYILKKMAERLLPEEIVRRKKRGFAIPAAKWIAGDLRETFSDLLGESNIKRWGFFDPRYVSALLQDHLSRRRNNRKPLWTLFMFHLWLETHYSASEEKRCNNIPVLIE